MSNSNPMEVEDIKSGVHHGHEKYDEHAEIYGWHSVASAIIIVALIFAILIIWIRW